MADIGYKEPSFGLLQVNLWQGRTCLVPMPDGKASRGLRLMKDAASPMEHEANCPPEWIESDLEHEETDSLLTLGRKPRQDRLLGFSEETDSLLTLDVFATLPAGGGGGGGSRSEPYSKSERGDELTRHQVPWCLRWRLPGHFDTPSIQLSGHVCRSMATQWIVPKSTATLQQSGKSWRAKLLSSKQHAKDMSELVEDTSTDSRTPHNVFPTWNVSTKLTMTKCCESWRRSCVGEIHHSRRLSCCFIFASCTQHLAALGSC
eukprot:1517096-Amphidinium_carterae.1